MPNNMSSPAVAADMKGYLTKSPPTEALSPEKASGLCRWHRRYFVLQGAMLSYYVDENCAVRKGQLDLTLATRLREDVETKKQHCFCIETNNRQLFLLAESAEDKKQWLYWLRGVTGSRFERVDSNPSVAQRQPRSNSEPVQTRPVSQVQTPQRSTSASRTTSTSSIRDVGPSYPATYRGQPCLLRFNTACPGSPLLEMLHHETKSVMLYWPLANLRGYGQEGATFAFEAGRSCPSGEGEFTFILQDGANLYAEVDRVVTENLSQTASAVTSAASSVATSPAGSRNPSQRPSLDGITYEPVVFSDSSVATSPVFPSTPSANGSPARPHNTSEANDQSTPPPPSVNYAIVDLKKTQALGKTLQDRQRTQDHPIATRQTRATRHDKRAFPPASGSPNSGAPSSPVTKITEETGLDSLNDQVDALLNDLEVLSCDTRA